MRKILFVVSVVMALAIPITAFAHAQLNVSKFGDLKAEAAACPTTDEQGAWYHFVLNKVAGDYLAGVTISVNFGGADQTPQDPVSPTAMNKSTQHFDVWSNGVLTSATTTGVDPGARAMLVLSGVACGNKGGPVVR